MANLDPRLVRVSLQINGQLKTYGGDVDGAERPLHISSTGCKFGNALQNEAEIVVSNLTKSDRDYLLTECSPFNQNRTPKLAILEAGRASTGLTQIYKGNIVSCAPSQPPDIALTFKCQTGAFNKGKIVASAQAGSVSLSQIARQVASDTDTTLQFEADDKNIANYAFTGGALKQVGKIGDAGQVDAFIDDDALIVKNYGRPLSGVERVLSEQSGMIGIPEITEHGVKVTYLLDNQSKLGGALKIQSEIYPALNGSYTIYKLNWNIQTREKRSFGLRKRYALLTPAPSFG
jgi:hypothetical protein